MPRTRRLGFQLFLWFVAALIVREAHFAFVADSPLTLHPTSDEFEHWSLAVHLAGGDWLGVERGAYHRPELFPYVLAILLRLTGGRIDWIHQAILLFDSLAVALIWLTARLALTRRAAFWGGLAAVTYWPFVHFSGTIYMESFALLVQAAMLAALVLAVRKLARRGHPLGTPEQRDPRDERDPKDERGDGAAERPPEAARKQPRASPAIPSQVLWAGAFTGLLLLTRPQTMIAVPVMLLFLALAAWRGRRPRPAILAAPLLCAAMTGLVLLPNAVRNYVVSDQWVWYSSNGALNFYFSNNNHDLSWRTVNPGIEWNLFIDMPRVEEGIGNDREARMEYWRRKSIAYVRDHFDHFLGHFYDKLLLVWNARIVHCTNNFEWMARLSPVQRSLPGFGIWGTVSVAGLILAAVRFVRAVGRRDFRRRANGEVPPGAGPLPSNGVAAGPQYTSNLVYAKTISQGLLGGYAIAYMTGVALFLAIERHRLLPLAPLFLFGGLWIAEGVSAIRGRRWPAASAALAATALAALLVNWPLRGPALLDNERFWTRVNLAVACRAEARESRNPDEWFDKAHDFLVQAFDILPGRLEPIRQLVGLAEERSHFAEKQTQYAEARKQYAEARFWESLLVHQLNDHYPLHVRIRAEETARLVRLDLQANQVREAVATARALVRLVPSDAGAHQYLGVALMAAGDNDAARREFQQTLQLDPTSKYAQANLETLDRATSPTIRKDRK